MCRKLGREKQNSVFNKQDIDSCESDCVCAESAGVSHETSDMLCKAYEAREAEKAYTSDAAHGAEKACTSDAVSEAGEASMADEACGERKSCLAERTHESEVLSGQKAKQTKKRSSFGLSFYNNADMDAFAQKAYKSDMSDEELKRSRMRDWVYIFIGVPLLIGVIYLIALFAKTIE